MTDKKPKKGKSLFDHLKAITSEQDPDYFDKLSETDKKTWSNYMLLRFMSMNDDLMPLVGELQALSQTLEPELFYKTFIGLIPKGNYYAKYIKSNKGVDYPKWLLELVAKDYEVSQMEARDYLEILYSTKTGKETVKSICERYGIDKSEIKKLKLRIK